MGIYFGGNKNILSIDHTFCDFILNSFSNLLFASISIGSINVTISDIDCISYWLFSISIWLNIEGISKKIVKMKNLITKSRQTYERSSNSNDRHFVTVVQFYGWSKGWFRFTKNSKRLLWWKNNKIKEWKNTLPFWPIQFL